jgi:hypothetical protein
VLAGGARADLIVLSGARGDPYSSILHAGEGDLRAVLVNGVARYGTPGVLARLGVKPTERLRLGGRERALNLDDPTTHPQVAAVSLAAARSRLQDALAHLPELARAQEDAAPHRLLAAREDPDRLRLVLDELGDTGFQQRPRFPFRGELTGPELLVAAPRPPLSEVLGPLELDRLTVADDPDWLARIQAQGNLPTFVRNGLRALYP